MNDLVSDLAHGYYIMKTLDDRWIIGMLPIWLYDQRIYYVRQYKFAPGIGIPVDDPE